MVKQDARRVWMLSGGSRLSRKPKIRHLTSVHDVDDSRILNRECRSLALGGYDVGLVVGRPSRGPLEGVRIVGVGAARNRWDRAYRVAWKVYRAALREEADIYHFHDPELLWVGLLLKLHGRKVIYDVHEDVPKQIMNTLFWLPRWLRRPCAEVARLLERIGASLFDGVVVANPATAKRFPIEKTVVVQNFPARDLAESDCSELEFDRRPFAFAYTGGLSEVQGIGVLVAATEMLGPQISGVLAGWFDDADLKNSVQAVDSLRYLGQLPQSGVISAIRKSQIGLALNRPNSQYLDAYSTKMFEYMACGVPVICSNFPHWAEVVDGADCGITVDPLDPSDVAEAIQKVVANPQEARRLGENGRKAVLQRYNWDNEFGKLEALYRRITPG